MITSGARDVGLGTELDAEDPREALALQMLAVREAREQLLHGQISGQPAWDILLALYLTDKAGVEHNIGRMIELSHSSVTTGLRYIDLLEAHGLVHREQDKRDGRVWYLNLSAGGRKVMEQILSAGVADGTSLRRRALQDIAVPGRGTRSKIAE